MAIVALTTEQRKHLVNIIAQYADVGNERRRNYFLDDTDLRYKAPRVSEIHMDGSATDFAREVISKCQMWGTLQATQQPALVLVFRYLRDEVVGGHEAEVEFLDGLLAPFVNIEEAKNLSLTQTLLPLSEYISIPTDDQKHLLQQMLDVTIPVLYRAQAGNELAHIGDPRQAVMTIDGMQFCYIPKGPFWMGSNNSDAHAEDNEKPAEWYEMDYDYWVTRFPISNSQFNVFVGQGGYKDEQWWSYAKRQGFWSVEGFKGVNESQPRLEPTQYYNELKLPNQPVVGISWYEANAFTEWLTARWRKQGYLIGKSQIVLPNEPEWEKAARGGEEIPSEIKMIYAFERFRYTTIPLVKNTILKRLYPYSDEVDTKKSNYDETDIMDLTTIGMFAEGASPYGCEDMSGNVWEWTRSAYIEEYPYNVGSEYWGGEQRVLRGGAFNSDKHQIRSSYRYTFDGRDTDGDIGFRVAVIKQFL